MNQTTSKIIFRYTLCRRRMFLFSTLKILICMFLLINDQLKGIQSQELIAVEIGHNFTITCNTTQQFVSNVTWKHNEEVIANKNTRMITTFTKPSTIENINEIEAETKRNYESSLFVTDAQFADAGIYSCEPTRNDSVASFTVQVLQSPHIVASSEEKVKQRIGHAVELYCLLEVFPHNETFYKQLKWLKDENSAVDFLDKASNLSLVNVTCVNHTLSLTEVYKKENGTYSCVVYDILGAIVSKKDMAVLVMDVPQVSIDYVKAVGADKIYLNWTVNDGNDPVQKYFIQYKEEGSSTLKYYNHIIGGRNTSYVLEKFQPNTSYTLRISAKNSIGSGAPYQYPLPIRTLEKDPIFIPKVGTTGSTPSTITIGWDPPPLEMLPYIQYYELVVAEAGETPRIVEETVYQQNSRNLPYMFDNLKTATEYEFKVRACSDLTKQCGPWSEVVNGTTMDGVASEPTDLYISCDHKNNTRHSVAVRWHMPKVPNGKVVSYHIQLDGSVTYKLDGKLRNETWGPKIRRVDDPHHSTIYNGVNPNTNYTVTVSAITRHRKIGVPATAQCTMPISIPDTISRIMWTKVKAPDEKCVFKLFVPRISERNGPICCYRLYLVRMGNNKNELVSPEKLNISTYQEVHAPNNTEGGAYLAEMFSDAYFRSEIFLGDGKRFFEHQDISATDADKACRHCLRGRPFLRIQSREPVSKVEMSQAENTDVTSAVIKTPPELSQREQLKASNLTEAASKILDKKRRRRRRRNPKVIAGINSDISFDNLMLSENESNSNAIPSYQLSSDDIVDGEIDMNSNYTGFLEVIVRDGDVVLTAYSNYFEIITPGTVPENFQADQDLSVVLNIVIQALAILIGIVLVLIVATCFLHHYNTKNSVPGEEISLRDSLSRALFRGRTPNHRHFIGSGNGKSSDIGPIHKADLCTAYRNRHKDTDYGFLREYEMLPNRFSDRTTKNSDMKENASKNRYPDIKAYDQTRVKLSQLNGIQGSDYINANFVIGYKERKKFICAQGPMESTVNDFWRMIWEQHLEIIVMLTNLEEYNKSKCAKYWPEKISDAKQFGEITVKFVAEKKLGDYLVRNLDVTRRNSASNEEDEERRQITQYHYLVWKDFMAPEHPHGIIKFVRQINAVYSLQRGPILVHCSAGVGRTGTLVALDSLIQQLEEEDQVSIFNTVCDLRHQRNFLVQSLKQYIFLYRSLLDIAQFGNTELSAVLLSSKIDSLKQKLSDGKDKSKLEIEFEKLLAITDETAKSSAVGSNEENMSKNRNEAVIPYDRNRVILTPIPMKENSTYINASFIEGYDNSEAFIITQDPLENTIGDFWRMISEQSITTLVMISEIGDGPRKCPRYWADDEIQYDHILVKYMQSESCPYYTRREFNVTNCKIDDTIKVTQFQYNGWPTVDGEVPEVCRGIIELVDQALNHHNRDTSIGCKSPLTVHCSLGTDRSSIFVTMCILVQQLRTEKGIDICSTARKIRSQRPRLLNSFAQYEFLHRAIANYADLHKLSTETASSEC
ncbi:tyrosine-protein phosphatase 69D [Anastrepha ludens]|uniref:tyrosine-protein phosphatase 69D n=1 Tax=Anastrepha ludens TaxID=28586 RepID=UPI0023B1EE83|nr:tyrosine-protein phosphatase 69D [Anastrepha ludens]